MVVTIPSPFGASAPAQGRIDDETYGSSGNAARSVTEKPSDGSLATSVTQLARESNHAERPGRTSTGSAAGVPRPSDLSSPTTVHHHNPFDTDIEAMVTHTSSKGSGSNSSSSNNNSNNVSNGAHGCSGNGNNSSSNANVRHSQACRGLVDAQVWPGHSHWKKKAKEQKIKRSRTCLSRLGKRNRLVAKICIGLLVVGVAVGVGVGISKPLGAPIWGQPKTKA